MNRQQFIQQLRSWAARAASETTYSLDTGKITWQSNADVLRATAEMLASGANPLVTLASFRKQVIGDRLKSIQEWESTSSPQAAAQYAGEV